MLNLFAFNNFLKAKLPNFLVDYWRTFTLNAYIVFK